MKSDPPTLVPNVNAVELSDYNAPKSCTVCGDDADYYVFITDEEARSALPPDADVEGWPVNAMLCRQHFRDAPRVRNVADLPRVGV